MCQSRKEKEDGYSVSLNETYSWEEVNFKGEITIINDTDKPIESWELKVDTNFTINKITNSWAAEVTDLENGQYLLKCTYNYVIQPYSSVVLGFVGEKNGIPEIYNYSLTEITVDENILSSVIENKTEDEPEQLTELSLYAICTVMENELNISWITDKEVSDVEYRIAEINAGEVPSYIASTNELSYAYTLENNFDTKRIYIEAYYKDLLVGKSNDFIVKNSGGVFSSERVDTDGDNISDYIEGLIGTDINKADTDEDGLDDYLEFFVLDLDPLKNDTDENGILDGDEDSDGDGLTNLEESAYPTNPVNFDSDNDKLSDYDEIFVYNTDPLSEDTDNDTIFDYDEVMLGINPNDNSDFNKVIEQKIEKDSKCLAGINVEGLPYKVSIEIKASGYVEGSMKVDNSMSYASTYSFDTIGEIPEFSYNAGNVEEVTIDFEFEDEYIEENNIDISSLNVFKYFDGVNMFVPIKTFRNEDTNTLSCKSDSLGTYCVKDIDEWMLNFTEPDSEETEKVIMFLEDSDIAYMSDENDIELLSDDVFVKEEPINVVFALDQTFITGSLSGMENMKANVINVSEKLFGKYKNIKVTLMIYNNMGTYFDPCEDIGSLKNVLRNVEYICGDANNLPLIEAPMYSSTILLSNLNPKYLFIYNGFMNRFYPPEKSMVENALNNEKNCHISFVSGMNSIGVDEYISYYANKYSGKLFDLNSKTIDNEVLSFIEKEPKLIRKALNNTDDEEDLPTVEPDEKELTKTYILSTNLTTVTLDESLKKNSKVDSDDDGLTDVEELIQSDKLIKWDIDGNVILPTLNEVIRYCGLYAGMKYLPDDILDNKKYEDYLGKEVLPVRSNPKRSDTDYDSFSDSDEILNLNTNPLKTNNLLSATDIDFLTDNNRYAATACRDYNQHLGPEIMTFIANNIYGSVHDYKLIYKEEILKHIKTLSSENQKKRINFENTLYVSNILTQVEALMSEIYKSFANIKYEQVIDDFANERVILFKQYKSGLITTSEWIDESNELILRVLDNDIVKNHLEKQNIRTIYKFGDKLNFLVTNVCIIAGGSVQVYNSVKDVLDIGDYENTIRSNINVLDEIIKISDSPYFLIEDSICLRNAAKELKRDIEDEASVFYNELVNIETDFLLAISDGYSRMKIANCGGTAAAVIAIIALFDLGLDVSKVGSSTLKCYADATTSDALCNILNSKISKLSKNRDSYEHIYLGEYIVYDNIQEYNNYIIALCVSREIGESNALDMNKGAYAKLWVKIWGADGYFESVSNNISQLMKIKERY